VSVWVKLVLWSQTPSISEMSGHLNNLKRSKSFKLSEEFEDTKGAIRIRISKKNRQTTQWPKEKVQTTIYKTYT